MKQAIKEEYVSHKYNVRNPAAGDTRVHSFKWREFYSFIFVYIAIVYIFILFILSSFYSDEQSYILVKKYKNIKLTKKKEKKAIGSAKARTLQEKILRTTS